MYFSVNICVATDLSCVDEFPSVKHTISELSDARRGGWDGEGVVGAVVT